MVGGSGVGDNYVMVHPYIQILYFLLLPCVRQFTNSQSDVNLKRHDYLYMLLFHLTRLISLANVPKVDLDYNFLLSKALRTFIEG